MLFQDILNNIRQHKTSEHDKGTKFERLMQGYLQTDGMYATLFKNVWLWAEFPAKNDLGGKDTGIDLVALTHHGEYWAIQCKFYDESTTIDKPEVDTFLSTSSRQFKNEQLQTVGFAKRLWISTTNKWGREAENAITNQNPEVIRLSTGQLNNSTVDWAKIAQGLYGKDALLEKKKTPKQHQEIAIKAANEYFKTQDRGKLIMACGTGKTFTSLKIAEKETNHKGLVLFLVPSIALLGQSLREWTAESEQAIFPICICSDANVSKKRTKNEDTDGFSVIDLALPASTDVPNIIKQFEFAKQNAEKGMTVVFSTYQSIEVIAKAQAELLKNSNFEGERAIFDLIICDEAHRTTGITLANEDSSAFVKVHDNEIIKAKKRMYMTATPRLYADDAKSKADRYEAVLCSMDDDKIYGEEIYRIGFGNAVEQGLLSDYKVLILTMSQADIPEAVQNMVADTDNEINTDDASKLIGCINALSKHIIDNEEDHILKTDPNNMRRAVAFCSKILDSKKVTNIFNGLEKPYYEKLPKEKQTSIAKVKSKHVDGTMSAPQREDLLNWLKENSEDNQECRILTNAKCLSEGVDVPALDAVIFLSSRDSQVDVVQSVGRVMRLAPNKKYGYIIIPVVIPTDVEPDRALDDNDRYKVVWSVLNALRAHDERFDATINQIELNRKKPAQIKVVNADTQGNGTSKDSQPNSTHDQFKQTAIDYPVIQGIFYAKMVQKVGDKRYWEQWAKDVAIIAERHVERINRLIAQEGEHKQTFIDFLTGLQRNINPAISQSEAVEMLSQHLITKPVFDALFSDYSFVKNNPVSLAMQTMLEVLENQALEKETEVLEKFYESVKKRAAGLDNAAAKQKIIVELYDKFFKTAFPKMVEKLGIVYTPVEVVDFIVHSVDVLLKKEFDRNISDENIHILDPFTGTGTFMTRLLQNKLIKPEDLHRKYTKELHANEIVLLAYYIAAINIENAYHEQAPLPPAGGVKVPNPLHEEILLPPVGGGGATPLSIAEEQGLVYTPFNGIVLTDTFQLGETDDADKLFSDKLQQNSERVIAQKKAPLRIIMGNPPYSVGQKSANDNAQNQEYKELDKKIAKSYAANTNATLKNSLYDSYIKAFRWSSDRLDKEGGIIAFVSNGSWLDGNATDGFRKCLEKEFSAIYVFNLRGNQRTSGELSRREGGKIFGSGSRTPITITFLVKNPSQNLIQTPQGLQALAGLPKAVIHYHDIGDYLNREEKLALIKKFKDIDSIEWQILQPNEHADWISQRNEGFESFVTLGDKDDKNNKATFFVPFYGRGLATSRDAWCYNSNKNLVVQNINTTINFYNEQVDGYIEKKIISKDLKVDDFITIDSTKITWDRSQKEDLAKYKKYTFDSKSIYKSLYRPFYKQFVYFNRQLNNCVYKLPSSFPLSNTNNLLICVPGAGDNKDFSVLITNLVPDLGIMAGSQCFPLYYYEEVAIQNPNLFEGGKTHELVRRDGVSNFILDLAQKVYGNSVSKEDIFYYVYGALHSESYRGKYANDLKKMLPRLPLVEESKDFWAFSKAGRKLAALHLNYETGEFAKEVITVFSPGNTVNYQVEKMRFGKKESITDKSVIHYNSQITIENIPLSAYNYVVNGKSAVEWIMERYQITVHKESGIRNNPNDWAVEVGNEKYIYELLLRVIRLSVETVEIVRGLPVL
jgi:predicted helicase